MLASYIDTFVHNLLQVRRIVADRAGVNERALPPLAELQHDPGLEPLNIYDRGLIENFKEVMFPRCIYGGAAGASQGIMKED